MPRGSRKTTIAECACLWAILFGHREFVALIGASEVHAAEMLDSIKTELDGNELLLEDFPEGANYDSPLAPHFLYQRTSDLPSTCGGRYSGGVG